MRHAYFMDYYCVVPSDCVATYSDEAHAMSLTNIEMHFGQVATSERILRALLAANP